MIKPFTKSRTSLEQLTNLIVRPSPKVAEAHNHIYDSAKHRSMQQKSHPKFTVDDKDMQIITYKDMGKRDEWRFRFR